MKLIIIFCLIIVGVLLYIPTFQGELFWDDLDFIVNNTAVQNFSIGSFFTSQAVAGAQRESNYFRPIQFSLYSIIYHFFQTTPLPYKLISVFIHCGASIAVFLFIVKLVSLFYSQKKHILGIATVISVLFLIHPIQTESVSYVSGLSDPLVALFGFLSLYTFLHDKQKKRFLMTIVFCCLALLSKEIGVIFSGILGVLWLYMYAKDRQPSVLFPLIIGIMTLSYLIYHTQVIHVIDMKTVWGDHPYTHATSIRLSTFFTLLPTYISLILFPLTLFYDRDFSIAIPTTYWQFQSALVVTVVLLLFFIQAISARQDKMTRLSLLFFIFFFISFLPFSGLILINGIFYEHYVYIPLVFFFGWLTSIGYRQIEKCTEEQIRLILLCLGFLFSLLALRNVIRQKDWQTAIGLYEQTLTHVPQSFRVRNNLASEYMRLGEKEKAIKEYTAVIELNPTLAHPYHNLGIIALKNNDKQTAKKYFLKALEVNPQFVPSQEALKALEI